MNPLNDIISKENAEELESKLRLLYDSELKDIDLEHVTQLMTDTKFKRVYLENIEKLREFRADTIEPFLIHYFWELGIKNIKENKLKIPMKSILIPNKWGFKVKEQSFYHYPLELEDSYISFLEECFSIASEYSDWQALELIHATPIWKESQKEVILHCWNKPKGIYY